jgi:hypothetical protein
MAKWTNPPKKQSAIHEREEIEMSHIHRYRHVVRVLVVCASTLLGLAVSAPAAFAMRVQDLGGSPPPLPTGKDPTYTLPHTVVTGGIPGWQLAVIVAGAALLAAVIAAVVRRVRAAHRARVIPAA